MTSYRDIRDPDLLGQTLLKARKKVPKFTLSQVADAFGAELRGVAAYQSSTLGEITAQEYLDELQSRTDRYAASTLEAIRLGKKPPIDPYGD